MTGMKQTKAEFLDSIKKGILNYSSNEDTKLDIFTNNRFATIIEKSNVKVAVFGGNFHKWNLQLHIKLKRDGTDWLITDIKASTY